MNRKRRRGPWPGRVAALGWLWLAASAGAPPVRAEAPPRPVVETASIAVQRRIAHVVGEALIWYEQTPPAERIAWGGLVACLPMGLCVLVERAWGLRRRAVIPGDFTARFLDRLHEGKLDGGKALDYCEMNPSPAARVALAAVRRWGRPAAELERAVGLAHRWESERLRRNVGTLRRIAVLGPLLGLLGALLTVDRMLSAAADAPLDWPTLAEALRPLIAGLALATAALVAFDLLTARIERLGGDLDRLGAETVDAVAMATGPSPPIFTPIPHVRLGGGGGAPRIGSPRGGQGG